MAGENDCGQLDCHHNTSGECKADWRFLGASGCPAWEPPKPDKPFPEISLYFDEITARLAHGAKEYGMEDFDRQEQAPKPEAPPRPLSRLIAEALEETVDGAAWLYLARQRLRRLQEKVAELEAMMPATPAWERANHPCVRTAPKRPMTQDRVRKPIWEIADELMADVPAAEFDKLPRDGAENHDKHLYGKGGPK